MPENKMIHELPVAPRISSSDLFESEIPDTLSETGYKSGHHSLSVIENHVLGTEQYNTQLPNFPQGSRSVFSALEYARQSGGGGGASVVQKTLAEYQALPTSDKMNGSIYKITDKALIYCLDEEYHALKEITSSDYSSLTSDEKNNGTLYIITDEETTASDIPYSAGVSVADKLSELTDYVKIITNKPVSNVTVASDTEYNSSSPITITGIPTGYKVIGVCNTRCSGYYGSRMVGYAWLESDTTYSYAIYNAGSRSDARVNLDVWFLCIKV